MTTDDPIDKETQFKAVHSIVKRLAIEPIEEVSLLTKSYVAAGRSMVNVVPAPF